MMLLLVFIYFFSFLLLEHATTLNLSHEQRFQKARVVRDIRGSFCMNNDLDVLQEKLTALYNYLDAGAEGGVGDNAERNYSYGDNLSEIQSLLHRVRVQYQKEYSLQMELEEQYTRSMAELKEYDFQLSRAKAGLDTLPRTRQVDENGPSNATRSVQDDQIIHEDVALREDMEKVYINFLDTYKRNSELQCYISGAPSVKQPAIAEVEKDPALLLNHWYNTLAAQCTKFEARNQLDVICTGVNKTNYSKSSDGQPQISLSFNTVHNGMSVKITLSILDDDLSTTRVTSDPFLPHLSFPKAFIYNMNIVDFIRQNVWSSINERISFRKPCEST